MQRIFYPILLLCGTMSALFAQTPVTFQETNGLVVIEAESAATIPELWKQDTSIAGFTGTSVLRYDGEDLFNQPGRSLLTYKVVISTPGTYRFQWRTRIAVGDSNTEHNDSWLRLPDASSFFAQQDNRRLYPKGSGMSPNPEGSGSAGWFKVYQNRLGDWSWNAHTNDRDPYFIFATFTVPGTYTIEVAGRSNGHAVDRMVLYHSTVPASVALDVNQPESPNDRTTSVFGPNVRALPLQVFPNPAVDQLHVQLPATLRSGAATVLRVVNELGQEVRRLTTPTLPGQTLTVPVNDLPAGPYYLSLFDGQERHVGKFSRR